MRKPTDIEIERARKYVEDRVRICAYAESECRGLIRKAAEEVATVIAKYKKLGVTVRFSGNSACAKEIQEIIRRLLDAIRDLCSDYFLPADVVTEESDDTLNMIYESVFVREDHGATFSERLSADGVMLAAALRSNLEWGLDVFDLRNESDILDATDLVIESISSPANRLALLTINSIALGWSTAAMFKAQSSGKTGFWVINGPNPCKFCASMEGPHPIDDPAPCYHPRCQCITVFV